jgi:hypothetical protein
MDEIWDAEGNVTMARQRALRSGDIAGMLRQRVIRFVVANCGDPLTWIQPEQCYDYWKTEVKPRLVETEMFDQEAFPGAYCYVASEWTDGQPSPLVLLEMYH